MEAWGKESSLIILKQKSRNAMMSWRRRMWSESERISTPSLLEILHRRLNGQWAFKMRREKTRNCEQNRLMLVEGNEGLALGQCEVIDECHLMRTDLNRRGKDKTTAEGVRSFWELRGEEKGNEVSQDKKRKKLARRHQNESSWRPSKVGLPWKGSQ